MNKNLKNRIGERKGIVSGYKRDGNLHSPTTHIIDLMIDKVDMYNVPTNCSSFKF